MPYRNEEDALRSRVQNLEEELEEHAAVAQENEGLRLRVAELEGADRAVRMPGPTGFFEEATAALDRAARLERGGNVEEAAEGLVQFVSRQWPKARADVELARKRHDVDPCPEAMAILQRRRAEVFFRRWRYDVAMTAVFSLLWATVSIVAGRNAIAVSSWWALLFLPAAAATALIGACAFYTLSNANAWRSPIWGTVTQVTPPVSASSRGTATVRLDDRPAKDVLVTFSSSDFVERGMRAQFYRRFFTAAAWLP
jgi:hypothetical protein